MSSPLSSVNTVCGVLRSGIADLPEHTRAELALRGKRESFFRDLFSRQCCASFPDILCKPEWDIPSTAVERWRRSVSGGSKTKGVVDLALLETHDVFAEQPLNLVEFKLWYTLDAVADSKYRDGARTHHSISKSASMDRDKIRAVRGTTGADDYLVTYLLTVHVDRLIQASKKIRRADLQRMGVAYPSAHASAARIKEGFDSIRARGIERAANALTSTCGRTEHVHLGTGESGGIPVSLDCLVTEVT